MEAQNYVEGWIRLIGNERNAKRILKLMPTWKGDPARILYNEDDLLQLYCYDVKIREALDAYDAKLINRNDIKRFAIGVLNGFVRNYIDAP
jgi:hypothetical protein